MSSPWEVPSFSDHFPAIQPERPKTPFNERSQEKEKEGTTPKNTHVKTDGTERLAQLSSEAGFINNKLFDLFSEACKMAKDGDLDYQFVFFALHGDNIYKQPTDVRDYQTIHDSSVAYHTARPDYKMHGTIVKMPMPAMMADEAVVCHVCKKDKMVAAVASLADYDYAEVFSIM